MQNKTQKINGHINKAIATTVVVTAIGISTTISSLPVKSVSLSHKSRFDDSSISSLKINQDEIIYDENIISLKETVTSLYKNDKNREAREILKSFNLYKNPLALELRKLGNYALA